MIRTLILLAAAGFALPSDAQPVRVVTGDVVHIYGYGGQVLDPPALRESNAQARRYLAERRARAAYAREIPAVQTNRKQAPQSWWAEVPYRPPGSAWR